MFGTFFLSQHSIQYVRYIITDVKVCTELQTSIHSYSFFFYNSVSKSVSNTRHFLFRTPIQKIYERPLFSVPNILTFSFRTPGSFFYEHPSFVTRSCDIIHSEHPFSTLRTSVLLATDIR